MRQVVRESDLAIRERDGFITRIIRDAGECSNISRTAIRNPRRSNSVSTFRAKQDPTVKIVSPVWILKGISNAGRATGSTRFCSARSPQVAWGLDLRFVMAELASNMANGIEASITKGRESAMKAGGSSLAQFNSGKKIAARNPRIW